MRTPPARRTTRLLAAAAVAVLTGACRGGPVEPSAASARPAGAQVTDGAPARAVNVPTADSGAVVQRGARATGATAAPTVPWY
jgi:hypothetical protein